MALILIRMELKPPMPVGIKAPLAEARPRMAKAQTVSPSMLVLWQKLKCRDPKPCGVGWSTTGNPC